MHVTLYTEKWYGSMGYVPLETHGAKFTENLLDHQNTLGKCDAMYAITKGFDGQIHLYLEL